MPTLLTSAVQSPQGVRPTTSNATSPTSITLSFRDVDFCLQPSDKNGEVSYKASPSNENGILVSLISFTGTLLVSPSLDGTLSIRPTTSPVVPSTASRGNCNTNSQSSKKRPTMTVVEEPDSPDIVTGSKESKKVSPGQQKLPFSKGKGKNPVTRQEKKQSSPSAKKGPCKRSQASIDNHDVSVAEKSKRSSTTKRPRLNDMSTNNHMVSGASKDGAGKESPDKMLPCHQPTQDELGHLSVPDLSQTMDSNNSTAVASESDSAFAQSTVDLFSNDNDAKVTSVQEILDRVNNSNDSVASMKKTDDDDEVATHMETDDDHQDKDMAQIAGQQTNGANVANDDQVTSIAIIDNAASSKGHGPPCARWGATMCQIQDNRILVYGGQSYDLEGNACIMEDVHIYNPKTSTWEKPINSRGEKRQWHSAVYVPNRKQIIAFGGETIDPVGSAKNKEKTVISDTLRVLDTDIMLWYPPAATGDIPTGRSGHSSVYFPETNEMILFGGVRGSKWLNAVSILDISSWVWTSPRVDGTPPKPRSFHSATAVGNKMVIFGGNNKTSCFNTVHVLESIGRGDGSQSPSRLKKVCEWKWSHPSVKGKAPFPRTGHSATLLEDGKTICIYGGWDPNEEDEISGEENIFNGSYLLDTEEWTWKEGPKAQPMGSGTSSHSVQDCGPKRCGHQAVLDPETGEVLVFGGRIPGEALAGDMQKLSPSS
ncbi:galactose oxidase [Nitzschia inconspicua]|uniref:Galactose oxidase n=1 Tax=Nitzschia inconspicua TaxID=303405 RepID=A0A9K3PGP2_9STRA|nr:galactose oxidase [Nitzschia inconspicua]